MISTTTAHRSLSSWRQMRISLRKHIHTRSRPRLRVGQLNQSQIKRTFSRFVSVSWKRHLEPALHFCYPAQAQRSKRSLKTALNTYQGPRQPPLICLRVTHANNPSPIKWPITVRIQLFLLLTRQQESSLLRIRLR